MLQLFECRFRPHSGVGALRGAGLLRACIDPDLRG